MITRRAVLWLWPLAAGVVATINDGPGYGVAVFVFVPSSDARTRAACGQAPAFCADTGDNNSDAESPRRG